MRRLKEQIYRSYLLENIPCELQVLTCDGKILQDNDKLGNYSIKVGSVLSLSRASSNVVKTNIASTGLVKTITFSGRYGSCGGFLFTCLVNYTSGTKNWDDILEIFRKRRKNIWTMYRCCD